MQTKEAVAKTVADAHVNIEPTISRVVRILGPNEGDPSEPIKLLEVNPATFAAGIVPISFGPRPPRLPFSSIVVEVTEDEFRAIESKMLALPNQWNLGETLYPAA